jgi:hypothetical protein
MTLGYIYTKREYEAVKAYIKAITKIEKARKKVKIWRNPPDRPAPKDTMKDEE